VLSDTERVKEIIRILKEKYPDARTTLDWETPFQLLAATILAAQSTDKKVNEVTKTLFKKYPTPAAFARANVSELEQDIHATGFFRQKARAIMAASQDIVEKYGGEIPGILEELTELRGVGRKTANVVLANTVGKQAIIVDTHMLRVSGRLGLADPKVVKKKDADEVERRLMKVVPPDSWTIFSHLILFLGRDICTAKAPQHDICPILHFCPTGRAELPAGAH
jgi:endonuclease-3